MATRNIVPRATGEGSLGTTLKRWATAFIDAITCTTINNSVANGTWAIGTATRYTLSGASSEWLAIAHDITNHSSYAMALIVVNTSNNAMTVFNLVKTGCFATSGWSASGLELQMTNDSQQDCASSLLRLR